MNKQLITFALCSLAAAAPMNTILANDTVEATASTSRESVERALRWLQQQASERNATRSDYETVARTIVQRAQEVIESEELLVAFTNDLLANLRRAVNDLEQKAKDRSATREDYERVVDMLFSRARAILGASMTADAGRDLRRVLSWLAEQASERDATRQDYTDAATQVIIRAREFFRADETEFLIFEKSLKQTLRDQLARLQNAIANRTATREQYMAIVEMLYSRAREVSGV